jgi:hypothetical protein
MELYIDMTVGSEANDALDAGANPAISTNRLIDEPRNLFFTEREWSRLVGWGLPPTENTTGMNSFDRASSTQADSPKDD